MGIRLVLQDVLHCIPSLRVCQIFLQTKRTTSTMQYSRRSSGSRMTDVRRAA